MHFICLRFWFHSCIFLKSPILYTSGFVCNVATKRSNGVEKFVNGTKRIWLQSTSLHSWLMGCFWIGVSHYIVDMIFLMLYCIKFAVHSFLNAWRHAMAQWQIYLFFFKVQTLKVEMELVVVISTFLSIQLFGFFSTFYLCLD